MDKEFINSFIRLEAYTTDKNTHVNLQGDKFLGRITVKMAYKIISEAVGMVEFYNHDVNDAVLLSTAKTCLMVKDGDSYKPLITMPLVDFISKDVKSLPMLQNIGKESVFNSIVHEFNLSYYLLFYEYNTSVTKKTKTKESDRDLLIGNLVSLMASVRAVEIENNTNYQNRLISLYCFDNTCLRMNGGALLSERLAFCLDNQLGYQSAKLDQILYSINNFFGKHKARGLNAIKVDDYSLNNGKLPSYLNRHQKEQSEASYRVSKQKDSFMIQLSRVKSQNYEKFVTAIITTTCELISMAVSDMVLTAADFENIKRDYPEAYVKLIDKIDSETLVGLKQSGVI